MERFPGPAHKPNSGVQYCLFCERRFSSLAHVPTPTSENTAFSRSRPRLPGRAYSGAYAYPGPGQPFLAFGRHISDLSQPPLSRAADCKPRELMKASVRGKRLISIQAFYSSAEAACPRSMDICSEWTSGWACGSVVARSRLVHGYRPVASGATPWDCRPGFRDRRGRPWQQRWTAAGRRSSNEDRESGSYDMLFVGLAADGR
jgi:YD repeat-containing protein